MMLVNLRSNCARVILMIAAWMSLTKAEVDDEELFTKCGGIFEEPRGFLSTPKFPEPYPTPIYCEWLIRAPTDDAKNFKIVLYFTQNYMKDSIFLTSYDYFQDVSTYVGRDFHGQIDWQNAEMFVSHKRFLLVQFAIESIGNRHLRVIDHLLDVYGFNITYEILDSETDVREKTCSVKNCSYLGNCEVSANFDNFTCRCFDKFFGDSCQYGPFCDPRNGVNMCSNGGECRYFFGSLINQCQCPEGYGGTSCEIVLNDEQNSTQLISRECQALGCSYQCGTDTSGNVHCICPEDFVLDKDKASCKQIEWYRFDVSLSFGDKIYIGNQSEIDHITMLIRNTIIDNGVTTLDRYEMQDLRNDTEYFEIEFSFYCQATQLKIVPEALNAFMREGKLNGHTLIKMDYEEHPGLLLTEVTSIEPHATLRGKVMSIVCAAKGSKNMKFSWYKDGARVNTRLTLRNAWESIYQHSVHGMHLYALNIDSALPIDQGIFTCVVEDYGEVQSKSVIVSVNNYPMVELDPMSLSVNKGAKLSFKCLSPDDSWQQFKYEWLRDGVVISADSKTEYAEEMLPTGVQLVVLGVNQHTEYMCRVTNEAGSANVSAHVYVIADNTTAEFCPRDYKGEVMWSKTSGGHFDVKLCPTEQGGKYFDLGRIDFGHARRRCECDSHGHNCKWAEPNLSKCQSLKLVHIHDQLDSLRSGYIQTKVSEIFHDLYTFTLAKNEDAILYSGDMDMVAGILHGLLSHVKTFPQLMEHDKKIKTKRLLELMSAILVRSFAATDEEKLSIDVGASILSTVHTVLTGAISSLVAETPLHISTYGIDLHEVELEEVPCTACENHPIVKKNGDDKLFVNAYSIHANNLYNLLEHRDSINNVDKNRLDFMPVSSIMSIAHAEDYVNSFGPPTVRFTIKHDLGIGVARSQTTVCIKWNYEARNLYSGYWVYSGCVTVESHSYSTTCECRLPGHFMAVAIPKLVLADGQHPEIKTLSTLNEDTESLPETKINLILVVGYSASLFSILVTAIIYIKLFRDLVIEIHTVHLSFIISVVCFTVACIVSVAHTTPSKLELEIVSGVLTFCCYVLSFALVLEMTVIYIRVKEVKHITLTRVRLLIACWGMPVILTIPLPIVSKLLDTDSTSYWLQIGTKEFIVFMFTIGLHTLIYFILFFTCICSLCKWTGEWQYADKSRYMKSVGMNFLLYILFVLAMLFKIDLNIGNHTSRDVLLITFHNIFCMMVFIVRIILNNHVRRQLERLFCGARSPALAQTMNNNSFCAYMKPEIVNNVTNSAEADNVSKYYDEVNRTKYTIERKRQLSFLLGSGSSADGTGSSESTTETSTGYYSKQPTSSPSFIVNAAIHSGTDGGILMKENSKSSTSSVGASGSVKDEIQTCNGRASYEKHPRKQSQTSLEQDLQRNETETNVEDRVWTSNQSLPLCHVKHKNNNYKHRSKQPNSVVRDKNIPDVHHKSKSHIIDTNDLRKTIWQMDDRFRQSDICNGVTVGDSESDVSVGDDIDINEGKSLVCEIDSDNEDDISSCGSKFLSSSEGGC